MRLRGAPSPDRRPSIRSGASRRVGVGRRSCVGTKRPTWRGGLRDVRVVMLVHPPLSAILCSASARAPLRALTWCPSASPTTLLDRPRHGGLDLPGILVRVGDDQAGTRWASSPPRSPRSCCRSACAGFCRLLLPWPADRGRGEERRCEEADREPDFSEPGGAFFDHVVGLFNRDVALEVLAHDDGATDGRRS